MTIQLIVGLICICFLVYKFLFTLWCSMTIQYNYNIISIHTMRDPMYIRSGRCPRCGWKPTFHLNGGESVTNHPDAGGNLYSTWMGVNQSLLTRIQVEGPFIWHFCLFLGNMLLQRYILMCWNMKIGFLSSYFNCMMLFSSYLAFAMVKHGRLVGDGSTVSCKSFLIVHLKAMIVNRKGV